MRRSAVVQRIVRSAELPLRTTHSPASSPFLRSNTIACYSTRPYARTAWASRAQQARRTYADSAADKNGKDAAASSSTSEPGTTAPAGEQGGEEVAKLKTELETKNKEIVDLKDKYLRSVADFRNLQERSKRDQASARDFAITKFAKDLVESIDNLDRALGTVPAEKVTGQATDESSADLKNLYDGLKMTEQILMSTLARHGLERFDPSVEGEKFDPNKHEAAFMTKMDDKQDGTVFSTMQKGFILNGRIIRAAKVGVVKNT